MRNYLDIKGNDAHWLKVRQGGKSNVHVDFVATSSTRKIQKSNTKVRIPMEETSYRMPGAGDIDHVLRKRSSDIRLNSNPDSSSDVDGAHENLFRESTRPAALYKCPKGPRERPPRRIPCALCEHIFPETSLGTEQLRSSVMQLRRIFTEMNDKGKEADQHLFYSTNMNSTEGVSNKVTRVQDRGLEASIDKYKFSRMYDKVKVCLFCSQFFPYENFRKAAGRHRRGAKIDSEQRQPETTDSHAHPEGQDMVRSLQGGTGAFSGIQPRPPLVMPKRYSAVSAFRIQKLRVKASKERAAQMSEIESLHAVLDILESSLEKSTSTSGNFSTTVSAFIGAEVQAKAWCPGGAHVISAASSFCEAQDHEEVNKHPCRKSRSQTCRAKSQDTPLCRHPFAQHQTKEASPREKIRKKKVVKKKQKRIDRTPRYLNKINCAEGDDDRVEADQQMADRKAMLKAKKTHELAFAKVRGAMHALWVRVN